nr:probable aspartyl protease At4g16563 [Ipomoea batatas]
MVLSSRHKPPKPMASFCSFFLSVLSVLSFLFPLITSSPTTTATTAITLPLSFFNTNPNQDPTQKLTHFVSLSLARAKHIKNSQKSSTTPLYPKSYGGYSISLSFGTPPQTLPFIMDTGSSFVWFPCTKRYQCRDCSFKGTASITPFMPKSSSSAKILGCANPKCGWIHSASVENRCQDCRPPFAGKTCNQICPPYLILYGSGSTGGLALVDTLDFPQKKIPGFVVGCSVFSAQQPAGIAGFGRGRASLPAQLGLKKFSYCLVSHRFDDSGKSSALVMETGEDSGYKIGNLSRTPLLKNPQVAGRDALSVYYYVNLRKITVGDQKLKIPYKYLSPDSQGNGGAIVDSGTTFTFLTHDVFELVQNAFLSQVKTYPRAGKLESITGLRPCFNISGHRTIDMPDLKFHFKGGAEMELPLANYFTVVGTDSVCLTLVTDNFGPELPAGPAIILGNFQMQNFYVEYDLKNEKLGFRRQLCK